MKLTTSLYMSWELEEMKKVNGDAVADTLSKLNRIFDPMYELLMTFWAEGVGPNMAKLVRYLFEDKRASGGSSLHCDPGPPEDQVKDLRKFLENQGATSERAVPEDERQFLDEVAAELYLGLTGPSEQMYPPLEGESNNDLF